MTSQYDIGDQLVVSGTEVRIIKVIDTTEGGDSLYLAQDLNENQFLYCSDDEMSIKGTRVDSDLKRKKAESEVSSVNSFNSTPSAIDWSAKEKDKFNYKFHPVAFSEFFGSAFPNKDDDAVKDLIDLRWDELSSDVDARYSKLLKQSHEFELAQTEASVQICLRTLFDLFGIEPSSEQMNVKFGTIDMVLSTKGGELMNCAIEVKGPAAFDASFREKCRNQLVAYIISMAIENAQWLNIMRCKTCSTQNLLGMLHIGLTPIFYKTTISSEYLAAISHLVDKLPQNQETPTIPELVIYEYCPIIRYTDRELLRRSSRSIIFKCYKAFKSLLDVYAEEKSKLILD